MKPEYSPVGSTLPMQTYTVYNSSFKGAKLRPNTSCVQFNSSKASLMYFCLNLVQIKLEIHFFTRPPQGTSSGEDEVERRTVWSLESKHSVSPTLDSEVELSIKLSMSPTHSPKTIRIKLFLSNKSRIWWCDYEISYIFNILLLLSYIWFFLWIYIFALHFFKFYYGVHYRVIMGIFNIISVIFP